MIAYYSFAIFTWAPLNSMVQLKSNVNFQFLAFFMQWISDIFFGQHFPLFYYYTTNDVKLSITSLVLIIFYLFWQEKAQPNNFGIKTFKACTYVGFSFGYITFHPFDNKRSSKAKQKHWININYMPLWYLDETCLSDVFLTIHDYREAWKKYIIGRYLHKVRPENGLL